MRTLLLALAATTALSACVVKQDPPIADEVLAASVYQHEGPARLTLFTMINNRSGRGAHSSLMINGSQRVIFDPAGSFRKGSIVTRDDVVYNVTPVMADFYTRFHARETYHVVVQEVDVSPEVAEQALQLAMARGEVPDAFCANSTSELLSKLPGFEGISRTWYPKNLSEQFNAIEGVTRSELYEYDDGDRFKALEAFDPERVRENMAANGL
jgi:hypothetical protein